MKDQIEAANGKCDIACLGEKGFYWLEGGKTKELDRTPYITDFYSVLDTAKNAIKERQGAARYCLVTDKPPRASVFGFWDEYTHADAYSQTAPCKPPLLPERTKLDVVLFDKPELHRVRGRSMCEVGENDDTREADEQDQCLAETYPFIRPHWLLDDKKNIHATLQEIVADALVTVKPTPRGESQKRRRTR